MQQTLLVRFPSADIPVESWIPFRSCGVAAYEPDARRAQKEMNALAILTTFIAASGRTSRYRQRRLASNVTEALHASPGDRKARQERHSMKIAVSLLSAVGIFLLLGRNVSANPSTAAVDLNGDGIVVTVNADGANVHFTYSESCDGGKPCYTIELSQGMVGFPTTAGGGCVAKSGGDATPTAVQCPVGSGSIAFKLAGGGTWSAYEGGGGLHSAGPCSPARVIVNGGNGPNPTMINSWNGCHEVVRCGTSGTVAVEADASDDISGKCLTIVKH